MLPLKEEFLLGDLWTTTPFAGKRAFLLGPGTGRLRRRKICVAFSSLDKISSPNGKGYDTEKDGDFLCLPFLHLINPSRPH